MKRPKHARDARNARRSPRTCDKSCSFCAGNRTHSNVVRAAAADDAIAEAEALDAVADAASREQFLREAAAGERIAAILRRAAAARRRVDGEAGRIDSAVLVSAVAAGLFGSAIVLVAPAAVSVAGLVFGAAAIAAIVR